MRIKDPELLLALCRTPLKTTGFIHLDHLGIEYLDNWERCPALINLSLHHNRLTRLGATLKHCRELWRVVGSYNKIQDVEDLSSFPALGHVDLSYNQLTYKALLRLREIHLIHLVVKGNPAFATGGLSPQQVRHNIIWLLPNLWVLDGRYITSAERHDAEAMVEPTVRALVEEEEAKRCIEECRRGRNLLRSQGEYTYAVLPAEGVVGSLAEHLFKVLSDQPSADDSRDYYRLAYLATYMEHEAHRYNTYLKRQTNGIRSPRMPRAHLSVIKSFPPRVRLDLVVVLISTLEYAIPYRILLDTICIVCAHESSLKFHDLQDLAMLPPYAICFLAYAVRDKCRYEIRHGLSMYSPSDAALVEALDAIILGVSETDTNVNNKLRHMQRIDLLLHHAVNHLAKSPSCPTLTTRPSTSLGQREYNAMLPLLKRASESKDQDDSLASLSEDGSCERSLVLAWSKAAAEDKYCYDDDLTDDTSSKLMVHAHGRRPGVMMQPIACRRCGDSSGHNVMVMLAKNSHTNRVNHELVKPMPGQWVKINPDLFTIVTAFLPEPGLVLVAEFEGYLDPPFCGRPFLPRDGLLWDPRGFWRCCRLPKSPGRRSGSRGSSRTSSRGGDEQRPAATIEHRAGSPVDIMMSEDEGWDPAVLLSRSQSALMDELRSSLGRKPPSRKSTLPRGLTPTTGRRKTPETARPSVTDVYGRLVGCHEATKEDAWMVLQKEMGSFRQANQYGAKRRSDATTTAATTIDEIKDILQMRKEEVGRGLFNLTAVGIEQDKDKHRDQGGVEDIGDERATALELPVPSPSLPLVSSPIVPASARSAPLVPLPQGFENDDDPAQVRASVMLLKSITENLEGIYPPKKKKASFAVVPKLKVCEDSQMGKMMRPLEPKFKPFQTPESSPGRIKKGDGIAFVVTSSEGRRGVLDQPSAKTSSTWSYPDPTATAAMEPACKAPAIGGLAMDPTDTILPAKDIVSRYAVAIHSLDVSCLDGANTPMTCPVDFASICCNASTSRQASSSRRRRHRDRMPKGPLRDGVLGFTAHMIDRSMTPPPPPFGSGSIGLGVIDQQAPLEGLHEGEERREKSTQPQAVIVGEE